MKITDVQEYTQNQFEAYRQRRLSQYIKFLDKDVNFITYYSINKIESTYTIGNGDVDVYFGEEASPLKYNLVHNMPVYGLGVFTAMSEYNERENGHNPSALQGELIFLPNVLDPVEGDWFVIDIFNKHQLFKINAVSQILIKSKPHFVASYHTEAPEELDDLNKQVVAEYTAIFDNIGTQDKVIISNEEYSLRDQYTKIYKEYFEYYKNTFFKPKLSIFEYITDKYTENTGRLVHYIDKYMIKFMENNRIGILDELLKDRLMLDYNHLIDNDDYRVYKKSLYWAIENKDVSNIIEDCKYITYDKINSPFTVIHGMNEEWYFTSEGFSNEETISSIEFDISEIVKKYMERDTSISMSNPYSRVLSIIVNYMYGNKIMPGYFHGIIEKITELQEYELIPIIMYIIRDQIYTFTRTSRII